MNNWQHVLNEPMRDDWRVFGGVFMFTMGTVAVLLARGFSRRWLTAGWCAMAVGAALLTWAAW